MRNDSEGKLPPLKSQIKGNEEMKRHLIDDFKYEDDYRRRKAPGVNMVFSAVYLVFLFLTLLFATIALFNKGSIQVYKKRIDLYSQISNDDNHQELMILYNGLRVAFVSTFNTSLTSAISLVVTAGVRNEQSKGIARLSQLIMEKRLKQNDFMINVDSALTQDRTSYTIELNETDLLEGLTKLTNVVLLKEPMTDEEIIKGIDQILYEHDNKMIDNQSNFIQNELLYHYFNDNGDNDHNDFKKITFDNHTQIRIDIVQYLESFYFANRMSVALTLNNQTEKYPEIRLGIIKILNHLRISGQSNEIDYDEDDDMISNQQLNIFQKELYESKFYWYPSSNNEINIYYLNTTFNQHFIDYFIYFFTMQNRLQIYDKLPEISFLSLKPFHEKVSEYQEAIGLRGILSKKGTSEFNRVMKGLLRYVNNFCIKFESEHSFYPGYGEINTIKKQKRIFDEEVDTRMQLVYEFAHRIVARERKEDLYRNSLHQYPKVIMIGDTNHTVDSFSTFDYYRHYHDLRTSTGVKLDNFNDEMNLLSSDITIDQRQSNQYISNCTSKDCMGIPSEAIETIIIDSGSLSIIHKQINSTYFPPKTIAKFKFYPKVFNEENAEVNWMYIQVLGIYLKMTIETQLIKAIAAGNSIEVKSHVDDFSLEISMNGYNDKMAMLIKTVMDIVTMVTIGDSEKIEMISEMYWLEHMSLIGNRPYEKANDYFKFMIGLRTLDIYNMHYETFNMTAILNDLVEMSQNKTLLIKIKGVIYGNADQREIQQIFNSISINSDSSSSYPKNTMKPLIGMNINHIHNPNIHQKGNVALNIYNIGKSTVTKDEIITWLLYEIIHAKFTELSRLYSNYTTIQRISIDGNIMLQFANEGYDENLNAKELNNKFNQTMNELLSYIKNETSITEKKVELLKLKYFIKDTEKRKSIETMMKRLNDKLNKKDSKEGENQSELEALLGTITVKDIISSFEEHIIEKPKKMTIQLYPSNTTIPN